MYTKANSCFIDRFNEEPKNLYTQESAAMGKLLEASKNNKQELKTELLKTLYYLFWKIQKRAKFAKL